MYQHNEHQMILSDDFFCHSEGGCPRITAGLSWSLSSLGLSDAETVENITENLYLQFFIGLHAFQEEAEGRSEV